MLHMCEIFQFIVIVFSTVKLQTTNSTFVLLNENHLVSIVRNTNFQNKRCLVKKLSIRSAYRKERTIKAIKNRTKIQFRGKYHIKSYSKSILSVVSLLADKSNLFSIYLSTA